MKRKIISNAVSAAHELTIITLKKVDRIFYRQRRNMEDSYGMPHGTFTKRKKANYPRSSS